MVIRSLGHWIIGVLGLLGSHWVRSSLILSVLDGERSLMREREKDKRQRGA